MTTKRQHLVWRKYLAQWTDDIESTEGKISWFSKSSNKVMEKNSINNIAVECYTYDISMINETDKKLIKLYFDEWLNNQSSLVFRSRLNNSNDIFKKDYIENNFINPIEGNGIAILTDLYNSSFPFDGPTPLEEKIKLMKKHLLNSLYSNDLIPNEDELLNLANYELTNSKIDKRYNFYEFISAQMLRTWRTKTAVINSIKKTIEKYPNSQLENTSDAIFPLMMVVNSIILATAFCKNDFYIQLIKNETEQDFITGDLPLINLNADYNELDNHVEKMELYYPISP